MSEGRANFVAGLTAAAVVVPKAVAYATIAGLPLQSGLHTAIIPMLAYAALGTSRVLSVSTTTTIAILTGAELSIVAPNQSGEALAAAAATLAIMVGVLLMVAAVSRLGFVANFISEPVLAGFKAGIGLVIVIDQLPKLLGIHIVKQGFARDVASIIGELPATSLPTLVVAAAILAVIVGLHRIAPRVPAPLVAIGASILASTVLGLERMGVAVIGDVGGGVPMPIMPRLDLVSAMWPAAAGIALMSFTESIAAARAFAAPGESRPLPNRELAAVGVANALGGLFGAMPGGGGTTQTAVNRRAGARTQLATVVTAIVALATSLVLGPLIALMPQAALAAVVIAYSIELIKPSEFRAIARVRRGEFYWAVIACAGVVLLGTLQGILVAVIASLLALAHQAYDPPVYAVGRKPGTSFFRRRTDVHPEDETWPGLLILRVEGRAFFLNAQRIGDTIWHMVGDEKPVVLLLDGGALIDIEYTALKMLVEAEDKLRQQGIELWLAALNPAVLTVIQHSPLGDRLGRPRMLFNVQDAVERYVQQYSAPALPQAASFTHQPR